MSVNNFVWADLSTFDLNTSKAFYSKVFGWDYEQVDTTYHYAYRSKKEVSGLYAMPETFVKMGMPAFWMSYIKVANVADIISKAEALGGKIELTESMGNFGSIALIRDPSGAGFTVYDGNQLNARTLNEENTMIWNELYVSDTALVLDFYTHLFNWTIEETDDKRFFVSDGDEIIAAIQQLDNNVKGQHEYWSVYFKVLDIEVSISKVLELGGKLIYKDKYSALLADSFGAMFQVVQKQILH